LENHGDPSSEQNQNESSDEKSAWRQRDGKKSKVLKKRSQLNLLIQAVILR
jgi:hypothetical protein